MSTHVLPGPEGYSAHLSVDELVSPLQKDTILSAAVFERIVATVEA